MTPPWGIDWEMREGAREMEERVSENGEEEEEEVAVEEESEDTLS